MATPIQTVVSHGSALALHGLVTKEPAHAPVHISLTGADRGRRPGIRPQRVDALAPSDRVVVDGLPVTTVVRTLVDVAGSVPARTLEQVYARATRETGTDPAALRRALSRRGSVPGADRLRALLSSSDAPAFTRSVAEDRLLQWIGEAGLPPPETNVRIGGLELDCAWRRLRLPRLPDELRGRSPARRPPLVPGLPHRAGHLAPAPPDAGGHRGPDRPGAGGGRCGTAPSAGLTGRLCRGPQSAQFENGSSMERLWGVNSSAPSSVTTMMSSRRTPNSPGM